MYCGVPWGLSDPKRHPWFSIIRDFFSSKGHGDTPTQSLIESFIRVIVKKSTQQWLKDKIPVYRVFLYPLCTILKMDEEL